MCDGLSYVLNVKHMFCKTLVIIYIDTWPLLCVLSCGHFSAASIWFGHKRALSSTELSQCVLLFWIRAHFSAKVQQGGCGVSARHSTFCFCCWLQFLVGSDSACWVQLQPNSGPDSERLPVLQLHCCWLQHHSKRENPLTSRWNGNTQHLSSNPWAWVAL